MAKKNIFIVTITIIIVGVIGLICLLFIRSKIETKKNVPSYFEINEDKEVDICINTECSDMKSVKYKIFNLELQNDIVQIFLKKINAQTEQYYQESVNSNMESPECLPFKDIYKHSLYYYTDYDLYNSEDFVSIRIRRLKKNVCTKETQILEPEIYLFDKNENREITPKEFQKKKNIKNEDIQKAIQKNIDTTNQYSNTNFTIENTYQNEDQNLKFFYSVTGNLYIMYFQNEDQNYYIATLEE